MRYRFSRLLPLLLGIAIASLGLGCSNSEGVDYAGWEEIYLANSENDDQTELGKQSCFNSYRLPNLQSAICRKQFYTQDTATYFPESGFFPKTFTIVFPNNKPLNCEIGGKVPTTESPRISTLQISYSTTIRCADLSDSATTKTEIIRTYILEKAPDIATVFITTDPNSLFDPDTGIYMEGPNAEEKEPHYGANYWLDKEIPVFVELIEPGASTPGFAKYAGLEIFGNWSRMHPKKSVAITFRDKYGNKRLYYPLFPDFPELKTFKSFILRNNGNNFRNDYIRDRLASSISEGLEIDYQRGRFGIVYYNSKYFGIHDLRERSNEYYFETHYGINHNNINLLKASNTVSAGSAKDYIALMEWLKVHNLDNDSNYAYISSKIDINNYINYMQIEMFANNRDWPGNNQKKWNCISSETPWKWFLYDLDVSYYNDGKSFSDNIFEYATSENSTNWANAPTHTFLFRSLLKNEKFKAAFINRMTTLLHTNLEEKNFSSLIDQMMLEIKAEIPRDQKRWSLDASNMNNQLEQIKTFTKERPTTITSNLRDFFKLGETIPINLSTNGNGSILVHGLSLNKNSVTIPFFKDHPVIITAKPKAGSSWSGWSDGETQISRKIHPQKEKNITAIFK